MQNPWINIPFADYENHMADPGVGQQKVLSDLTAGSLKKYKPLSIVLLGASTGNGLENVDNNITREVHCVDINQTYLDVCRQRFLEKIPELHIHCLDLDWEVPDVKGAELVIAALILEYVDPFRLMKTISNMLAFKGVARIVIQKSNPGAFVSRTRYKSLETLKTFSREIQPDEVISFASEAGLFLEETTEINLNEEKKFIIMDFKPSTFINP